METKQKKYKSFYFLFSLLFVLVNTILYLIIISPSQHIVAGICWIWAMFIFYWPFNLISFKVFPVASAVWSRKIFALLIGAAFYGLIFSFYYLYITKSRKLKNIVIYYLPFWIILLVLIFTIIHFCILINK